MSQELVNLPLKPSTFDLLQRAGFHNVQEVVDAKERGGISNLAAEMGCDGVRQAAAIFKEIKAFLDNPPVHETKTAYDIFQSSVKQKRSIITFSEQIDRMLGGGIAVSELTELVGLPGVGKTQMAMQCCVTTRLPSKLGGVEGEAIYIDTEGSFSAERCMTMAKALVDHVSRKGIPDWFTPEGILSGIHVFRVYDETTLVSTINSVVEFIKQPRQHAIQFMVLDSIAFHFRTSSSYNARTRNLTQIAATLSQIASDSEMAVLVVNQMTTRDSQTMAALGESWAHSATTRLLLTRLENGFRKCTIAKSPHKGVTSALYCIQSNGIRDVPTQQKRQRVQ